MVLVAEPAVEELTAERQEMVEQVTMVEQAEGLDQIWYHQAVHQVMGQVSHQEAQVKQITLQAWQSEAVRARQAQMEKRLSYST